MVGTAIDITLLLEARCEDGYSQRVVTAVVSGFVNDRVKGYHPGSFCKIDS